MGVFQLKRGNWGYRVLVKDENGVTRNRRAVRDKFGHKFMTIEWCFLRRKITPKKEAERCLRYLLENIK